MKICSPSTVHITWVLLLFGNFVVLFTVMIKQCDWLHSDHEMESVVMIKECLIQNIVSSW